jgi:hypothetical protein
MNPPIAARLELTMLPRSLAAALLLSLPGAAAAPAAKDPWWSLLPISAPAPLASNPVDHFIRAALAPTPPAPPADPRTLIRRLSYDLTGLPPSHTETAVFIAAFNTNPDAATAALADRLLASPQYGERWARHWLDAVHYGDTHGYDKDQPRPNAWPYRDYVIRAFNSDKPYARFVSEQLAGDVLFPDSRDGIEALGFISAGPWDLIGHAEVPEDKTDGKIARHLDRDDMVTNAMSTFTSLTVHCAQCHDHKFDPVSAEDYYSLQAVFAAVDRADRPYDSDPATAATRRTLLSEEASLKSREASLIAPALPRGADSLTALDKLIADSRQPAASLAAQAGFHAAISDSPANPKWVQLDLARPTAFTTTILHPCHDDFAGIGDGFGFPPRFKVEASNDPDFKKDVVTIADHSAADFPNPKITAVSFNSKTTARFVRVTATTLAHRQKDYIFALAELEILDASGHNVAAGAAVTSLDSVEAAPRWLRSNLTDRWYPGADAAALAAPTASIANLEKARLLIVESLIGPTAVAELTTTRTRLAEITGQLNALPPPSRVYCGTVHHGSGTFTGTGPNGGKPRPIHVLSRGDVRRPGPPVTPGAILAVKSLPGRFSIPPDAPEGERRAALARWITDPANPLTWRSIVNRVWQHHFGRGLVDTPGDFGRMGGLPSHPALLDWLAADFRDHGGSLKRLHRILVTSHTYRQSSSHFNPDAATSDPENRLLWRMNRRKLEAEAVRDSLLSVSGLLNPAMGGPAFQDFVVLHPEHSPHYEYQLADLANPALHRRSIYRFLVRSKPQPWMATLDCADPSLLVDRRTQTITPLQALAQLNNQLTFVAASHFATSLDALPGSLSDKIREAFHRTLQRDPSPDELASTAAYAKTHGLANTCRVLLNLNEFNFAD